MTPVDEPQSAAELQYNMAHVATHEIVDRTFRAIQTRFRCLDGAKGYLQVSCCTSAAFFFLQQNRKNERQQLRFHDSLAQNKNYISKISTEYDCNLQVFLLYGLKCISHYVLLLFVYVQKYNAPFSLGVNWSCDPVRTCKC